MKKNILTITYNDPSISWGPAVHYLELWNAFQKQYSDIYDIEGICPQWQDGNTIIEPKFKLHTVKVPNVRIFRQVIFDFYAAVRIITTRNSLIYIRLSHFHIFSIISIFLLRKKTFLELNGIMADDSISAKSPLWYRFMVTFQEKVLLKIAKGCIAVSEGIEKFAINCGAKSSICVSNGVSSRFFQVERKKASQQEKSRKRIIYVGTYTPWDGAKYIVELAKMFPDVDFLMFGDGKLRQNLENKAPANVLFKGAVSYEKLPSLYESVDAGIVLYEKERNKMKLSSLKTLEYMASGLPIFTTNVPGQEFISENEIGKTIEIENMQIEFKYFMENLELYRDNLESYRKIKGLFCSWEECARKTEQFFKNATS